MKEKFNEKRKEVLLITVATSSEANMIKSLLKSKNITSFIKEKGITGVFSEALFGADIYVAKENKKKALKIIKAGREE